MGQNSRKDISMGVPHEYGEIAEALHRKGNVVLVKLLLSMTRCSLPSEYKFGQAMQNISDARGDTGNMVSYAVTQSAVLTRFS